MSNSQGLDLAGAQASALELAARLLVRELDEPTLAALRTPSLCAALDAYDGQCSRYLDSLAAGGEDALEEAATDFCSLFVLSKETSPFASAWLGGEPSESGALVCGQVESWMAVLGVEVAPGAWGNLPRDHIAVLLGLVSLALLAPLSPSEAESSAESSADSPTPSLANLIAKQTLSWVPKFSNAVERKTQNPLYRAAARLAEHALAEL